VKLSAIGTDEMTYDLAVSGMTGNGTVIASLAAGVVHDGEGNPNTSSTSIDNSVTYHLHQTINGTSGDDVLEAAAGSSPSNWTFKLNGIVLALDPQAFDWTFDGLAGRDSLLVTGSSGNDSFVLSPDFLRLCDMSIVAKNFETISVDGGSGVDSMTFNDSTGNDSFEAGPGWARMALVGMMLAADSVENIWANSTSGNDTAVMYDSQTGNSSYVAGPSGVNFAGAGFNYTAAGFKAVSAYARPGTNNTAVFNSTDGHDLLIASYLGAQFIGQGFAYDVWNVPSIQGNAGPGDEARFYGSPGGNSQLTVSPTEAMQAEPRFTLKGVGYEKFSSYVYPDGDTTATIVGSSAADRGVTSPLGAQLFGINLALSAWTYRHINLVGNGGADTADMYGSTGADAFTGNGLTATMNTGGIDRTISNFSGQVTAHGNAASTATFFAKQGMTNTFEVGVTQAAMSGNDYKNVAVNFGSNTGYAIPGGTDVANFTDSAGTDYFISSYMGAQMFGKGFSNAGWSFATMNAISTSGADTARFYGSPTSVDRFVGTPTDTKYSGQGYQSEAKNFARVEAFAGLGTGGTAQLTGSTGNDTYVGSPLGVQLWNQNYRIEAWNFASVNSEGNGGNDTANMYGSASNNKLAADSVFAEFSGDGFANRVDHFATTAIHGSTSGSDIATLDHAYLETGVKDTPDNAFGHTITRKLWLYDMDQISITEKPIQTAPQPHPVDQLMTAFMFG
jgi:hypothetical protein